MNRKCIFNGCKDAPKELQDIMDIWFEKSKAVGDVGSCVIGAGFNFEYKGVKYHMIACSPWQGSISWEMPKGEIEIMLREIGCTDILYDWGRLD